jgi:hypothetical protein
MALNGKRGCFEESTFKDCMFQPNFFETATAEYYDAVDCATRIVPCISLVLLDKEK